MEQKMIYVGIDWANDHHDIVITDDSAKTLDQFRIDHTCDGFALLHSHIANHQTSSSLVLIAIETSRGLLVHELLQKGYTVYAINPKVVNRYKDRHVLSKAKSDVLDACRSAISCEPTDTCFDRSSPFPKITDFLIGFAATFGKRLMKNQELSTRLSPARKNSIQRRWKCFP